ncbi:MAG: M23 family metallopeptidase, partial [Gemmatimonadales bacterium]
PVLGITRRHEGTDYAAAPGTPVQAAGDGVVLRAGRAGGYGNLIELRHRSGITTRYGHLRGFARGVRAGARVTQGQTIGYVGSTGLASGPHLHYEFRVNGIAKDSRRVELGNGAPIRGDLRTEFTRERDRLLQLLQADSPSRSIAGQPSLETQTRWLP